MKLYRNILIFSVIIALLIVAVIFVNKIPDDKQNEEVISTGEQTTESNYIDVLRVEMNDITNVNVKTENEEYGYRKLLRYLRKQKEAENIGETYNKKVNSNQSK